MKTGRSVMKRWRFQRGFGVVPLVSSGGGREREEEEQFPFEDKRVLSIRPSGGFGLDITPEAVPGHFCIFVLTETSKSGLKDPQEL